MRWGASPAGVPSRWETTCCAWSCCPSAVRRCTRSSTSRRGPNCSSRRRGVCTAPRPEEDVVPGRLRGRLAGALSERERRDDLPRRDDPVPRRGRAPAVGVRAARWGAASAASAVERTPFLLERTLRFDGGLMVEERVTNEGDERGALHLGPPLVLGPPFLEAGLPARNPGSDDRDDSRAVGGHGAARAGAAERMALRATARRRHRRSSRGPRARGGEPRRRVPDGPGRRRR